MNTEQKIKYLEKWCTINKAELDLQGECGFGRECVGILVDGVYPDYYRYDEEYNRIDNNGEVWTPEDAYHKHPCVAVLGRGDNAINQLYEWIIWFEQNGFSIQIDVLSEDGFDPIEIMLRKHMKVRMVKIK